MPRSFPGPFNPAGLDQRIDRQDILDLEPAVAQAELILAVRLVDVTETKIVRGGRNVEITEQFRFEPVRVLKGIFARESLLDDRSRSGDLSVRGKLRPATRGQLLLVLLGRQGQNYFNCNGGQTLAQSIPRLESQDDPLLPAVDVLIAMTRKRDRADRIVLLRDGLKTASGPRRGPIAAGARPQAPPGRACRGRSRGDLAALESRPRPPFARSPPRTIELIMDADSSTQATIELTPRNRQGDSGFARNGGAGGCLTSCDD